MADVFLTAKVSRTAASTEEHAAAATPTTPFKSVGQVPVATKPVVAPPVTAVTHISLRVRRKGSLFTVFKKNIYFTKRHHVG